MTFACNWAFVIASSNSAFLRRPGAPYNDTARPFLCRTPRRPSSRATPLNIVIVGGGTAGWMTAAAFASVLGAAQCRIRLIESSEIGIVGVGEATLPHIRFFNQRIGIDERELMAKTQATFKLGIEFVDWARIGDSYIHPFGAYGSRMAGVPFHHYWLRQQARGRHDLRIEDYSLPIVASRMNKFALPSEDPAVGAVDLRLRLPVRRLAVRGLSARVRRGARRAAHGRQDRRREAARHGWLDRVGQARRRLGRDGRSVHRLLGLPRTADRAGAEDRLRRMDEVAALRSRGGRALRERGPAHALHARHRARSRLAVAHSAATPHGQRLRLQQRLHQR